MPPFADTLVDKAVRGERLSARVAREDSEGSLRDKCRNWYICVGTHVPRHVSRTRQDLGNKCYLPIREPLR